MFKNILLLCYSTVSASSLTHIFNRQIDNTDDTIYDRIAEFILFLTLAMDLLTLVATTRRVNRLRAFCIFLLVDSYYFFVMLIHSNMLSTSVSSILGVIASLCWWCGATAIAYFEFLQFIAIMNAIRPNYKFIAEGPRIIITLGVFVNGFLLVLTYSTPFIKLPAVFDNLTLVNVVQCIICVPRLFSTFWILYVVKDIAKITDGVVRKLGLNYIKISGIQIVNGLVGLAMISPALQSDSRFVSLVGSIVEILLHYSICYMLAAEISNYTTIVSDSTKTSNPPKNGNLIV
ncbi:hypothetical protein HDV06_005100 [Boothiomyces sp. JEL0866]|nr:hypothetical protein HDV06_005100 [Boothiomyces sp. JEL0866]